MANHTYSKGLLYKKTLNSSGEVTGSVPLLLKTLGSLVIMSDGTDAETAISTAISNMVTPDETTIVTGQDGITISVKKSTSAEIDEILGDVPTSHTWEGYYTKSETEALIDAVDDKISQSGIETALGYTPIPTTAKGSNNGVAELDSAGKVPASQLPSYVDDVIESATYAALPATGESGKIYVTLNDDKTYRWSGSAYVEISASLALGETSSTAYRGDRGKTAYDHSQAAHARTDATNVAIVSGKLNINGTATNIGDFKAVSTVASQGLTDTEKTNALANIGAVPNSDFVVAKQNILYGLNRNAKNLIDFKFNGTPTNGTGYFWDTACDLPAGTYSISFLLTSTQQVGMMVTVDGSETTKYLQTGTKISHEYTFTATTAITRVRFWINGGTNTIYDFMISLKDVYDADPSYQPYSAPNHDLTALEAEDRASLAEVIDSGAKNLINLDSCTIAATDNRITFTRNGNVITASCTGISSVSEISITNLSLPTNTALIISGCPSGGGEDTYMIDYFNNGGYVQEQTADTGSGSGIVTFTTMTNSRIRIRIASNAVFTNKEFKIMLCTKAAFGVSTKFVPYTKSNSQLTTELGSVKTVLEAIL